MCNILLPTVFQTLKIDIYLTICCNSFKFVRTSQPSMKLTYIKAFVFQKQQTQSKAQHQINPNLRT